MHGEMAVLAELVITRNSQDDLKSFYVITPGDALKILCVCVLDENAHI